MSSSILAPEIAQRATPMVWRALNAPSQRTAVPPAAAEPAKPPDISAQIAQLEQQWQSRVREAHSAGFREGEASGRARAGADVQPVIEKLGRAIAELAQLRPRLRREAEADMVKLALAIARRIMRREMAADPEALRGLLHAALDRLQGQEITRVRVHPSQADLVSACLRGGGVTRGVEVLADPGRDLGDAVFETQHGNLDASVESQLQEIERGLVDRLPKP